MLFLIIKAPSYSQNGVPRLAARYCICTWLAHYFVYFAFAIWTLLYDIFMYWTWLCSSKHTLIPIIIRCSMKNDNISLKHIIFINVSTKALFSSRLRNFQPTIMPFKQNIQQPTMYGCPYRRRKKSGSFWLISFTTQLFASCFCLSRSLTFSVDLGTSRFAWRDSSRSILSYAIGGFLGGVHWQYYCMSSVLATIRT